MTDGARSTACRAASPSYRNSFALLTFWLPKEAAGDFIIDGGALLDSAALVDPLGPGPGCSLPPAPLLADPPRPPGSLQRFPEMYRKALRGAGARGRRGLRDRAAAFSGQRRAGSGRAEEPRLPPAPSAAAHWRRRAGAGRARGARRGGRLLAGERGGEPGPGRAVPCPALPTGAPAFPPSARLGSAAPRSSRRTMVGDHCSLPGERPVLAQSPKPGLSCKMVLQAVGKVLR